MSVIELILTSIILVPLACAVLFYLGVSIARKLITLAGRIYLWTQQDMEQKK